MTADRGGIRSLLETEDLAQRLRGGQEILEASQIQLEKLLKEKTAGHLPAGELSARRGPAFVESAKPRHVGGELRADQERFHALSLDDWSQVPVKRLPL